MPRALLLVDVIKDFEHEDGDRLLASFRERHSALIALLEEARAAGVPVVYANDDSGAWDSDAPALLRRALAGKGGDLVAAVAPRPGRHRRPQAALLGLRRDAARVAPARARGRRAPRRRDGDGTLRLRDGGRRRLARPGRPRAGRRLRDRGR